MVVKHGCREGGAATQEQVTGRAGEAPRGQQQQLKPCPPADPSSPGGPRQKAAASGPQPAQARPPEQPPPGGATSEEGQRALLRWYRPLCSAACHAGAQE